MDRLAWERGYPYALMALRLLIDETGASVSYRIHGAGPELYHVLFTASDLELEGNAEIRPPLERRRAAEVLAEHDVYLDLRLDGGRGWGLAAAIEAGLPAVVSTAVAADGPVYDGMNGLVVPVRDPAAASRALARLLDPALRAELASAR